MTISKDVKELLNEICLIYIIYNTSIKLKGDV